MNSQTYKIDFSNGLLKGKEVLNSKKLLSQLLGVFKDEEAYEKISNETLIYSVQAIFPVDQGTEGGLFYGNTIIEPGKVGNEYFMTQGHFHEKMDCAEYYWGIKGEGVLLLMDENRNAWMEKIIPGSLHYIPGRTGHRTINIGDEPLCFGACWPSDAGYNYDEISMNGFSARMLEIDGKPTLVKEQTQ